MSVVTSSPTSGRASGDDRCPGAMRLHAADDGYVARVRIPGGRLAPEQVLALADLAESTGDGYLYVTSRGNVQLRGLSASCGGELAMALYDAGLLPSERHDRVRNIVASPLSGIDGPDIEPILRELDEALLDDDGLIALSGRFLFGIDNGAGDVLALLPDVAVVVETAAEGPDVARLVVAGHATAVTAPLDLAADLLIGAAHRFLALRAEHAPNAWRAAELPETALAELAPGRPGPHLEGQVLRTRGASPAHSGGNECALGVKGAAVLAGVALGSAPAGQWRTVAALATEIRLTPWRSIVLIEPDSPEDAAEELADLGFLLDDADPLAPVTACIGKPGCGKALADVRRDAADLAAANPGARLHVSGCDRRCGHPAGPHLSAVASPDAPGGYQIQEL